MQRRFPDLDIVFIAPYVGAEFERMEADTKRMRGERPYVFADTL